MPAKKGSKKLVFKNSYLGKFQENNKHIKTMEQRLQEQKTILNQKQAEVHENSQKLKELSRKLECQRRALSHKKERFLSQEIAGSKSESSRLKEKIENKFSVKVTACTAKRRKLNPTTKTLNARAKIVRRDETMKACSASNTWCI